MSRITIDIPLESHKRLKALAALHHKSMRELVSQLIDSQIYAEKKQNKTTIKAIEDARRRKGLKKFKNVDDLFKDLGI
jgi:hypothetical protein